MGLECIKAINGQRPFDVVIENVKIVNVFNLSVMEGSVAWVKNDKNTENREK